MRRGIAATALGVVGVLVAALTVPVSAASWVDEEWASAPVSTVDCGEPGMVDATAWGRMIAGRIGTQTLDAVAAIDGITVSNVQPATSSSAVSAASVTSLGADAWNSALDVQALGAVDVGAGVILPLGSTTGAYTQYGRATSAGLSVGASGAISTGSGVAALDPASSSTPDSATLQLSALLDAATLLGDGVSAAQLADVELRIGQLAALASYDSCDPLWDGVDSASEVDREYLISELELALTSSRVTDIATGVRTALTDLETTIDGFDYVTSTIPGALTTALNSALTLPGISLGSIDSLSVAIDVDLAPVRALVTGSLTDGAVAVNLATGEVTVDLAAIFGAAHASGTGLNGQDPNTSVLTAPMITEIATRVLTLVNTLVTTTIADAITTAIQNASVTVVIAARLGVTVSVLGVPTGVPNALNFSTTLSGTVQQFTSTSAPAPTATTTVTVASGLGGLLTPLVNALLSSTLSAILGAVATSARTLGAVVVTPLVALATTAASTTLTTLTTTTVPTLVNALSGVFAVLNDFVDVVVNGRPDVAAGSVGAPVTSPASGRYFETALYVGVVRGPAASLAALYLANASVGLNALR